MIKYFLFKNPVTCGGVSGSFFADFYAGNNRVEKKYIRGGPLGQFAVYKTNALWMADC